MQERPRMRRSTLVVLLGLATAVGLAAHGPKKWVAPEEARKLKNPLPATEASLRAAKSIYLERCAQCHGETGKGDGTEAAMYAVKPADFTDGHMMGEMSEGEIFWKISEGRRPMPSFKQKLSEEQRWQLVHYIRTFATKPAARPAAPLNDKKSAPHKHGRGPQSKVTGPPM